MNIRHYSFYNFDNLKYSIYMNLKINLCILDVKNHEYIALHRYKISNKLSNVIKIAFQ